MVYCVGCWGSHAPHFQPSLPLFPSSDSAGWYVPRKRKKQDREEKELLWLYIRDYFKSVAASRENRTHWPVKRRVKNATKNSPELKLT